MAARYGQRVPRSWFSLALVALVVVGLALHSGRSLGSSPPQLACSDDSYEPDNECAGYFNRLFSLGINERHQLCDQDWVDFEVVDGTRYRIETSNLTGGADTVLDVWGLDPSHCDTRLAFDDNGGGGLASRVDWTADAFYYGYYQPTAHVGVLQANDTYVDGMGYQLKITRIQRTYVVPVVAHAGGAGGELWVSDLWLFNPTDQQLALELVLTPTGPTGPQQEQSQSVTVAAGGTLAVSDPVALLFGAAGTGWLEVRSPGVDLAVASRICSDGTCQAIAVPARENARVYGWGGVLLPVAGTALGRTNLGLVELRGYLTRLTLSMVNQDGQPIGQRDLVLQPREHRQVNDVFAFLGAVRQDGVLLQAYVYSGGAVAAYGSVVDGQSSDASFVGPTEEGFYGAGPAVVPLACGGPAELESNLVMSNTSYIGSTFDVTFLPQAGSGQEPTSFDYGLAHGQTVVFDDVVSGLGGQGCGALLVDGGISSLASRTFRGGSAGTLGDVVPAVRYEELVGRGDGVLTVLGVESSSSTVSAVGWVNPTNDPGTLVVRLVSAAGVPLGELQATLEPMRADLVDDVFTTIGAVPQTGCRAELEVVDGAARIAAYAMVTDVSSGDLVVQPATLVPFPRTQDVYLSSRSVILVDQLPESVGMPALPSGTYTATVSGAGDLGADYLPIHVACLFHGPDGRLRSASLAIGESVGDVGGGQPFWCFIPDWIRSDDNWGAVEVELEGTQTITFQLDPVVNAVLLDRQEDAVIEAAPAPAYVMESEGHFGGPLMDPQLLVMAKQEGSHALDVVTLVDVDQVGPLWRGSQLLAIGLDHGSREDNRGSIWLRAQPWVWKGAVAGARSAKGTNGH